MVLCGQIDNESWNQKNRAVDFYYLKGAMNAVLNLLGVKAESIETSQVPKLDNHIEIKINGEIIANAGEVKKNILLQFGIKQPVFFASINWSLVIGYKAQKVATSNIKILPSAGELKLEGFAPTVIIGLPKYPSVKRDLALIVSKKLAYEEVEKLVHKLQLGKLQEVKLFDIFESEKLGIDKKSLAINFTFLDTEKTLTDKEIDGWMNKIMSTLEKELGAEIRK
jgi:phenylalanyl-tRNA synthetase beta chain